jgi:CheY-like chemotaxis protein
MSHELRTPLNAILGFAQLLQIQSKDPKTLESVNLILNGGRHLLQLINEVLDLSRIEAGKLTMSFEPVPFSDAIAQAVEMVGPMAGERGVTINFDADDCADLHAKADMQRLVQILVNLLTNGIKYNVYGGRIDIGCLSEGAKRRIVVADTGPGIDEELKGRLFQPFERARVSVEEGTGLGLALSRRLAQLRGGDLVLDRTGKDGSVFAVELQSVEGPVATSSIPTTPSEAASEPAKRNLRVVYIEDNAANLQLMDKILESVGGIDLIPAIMAEPGLALIKEHLPDLVLLDLHLPDAHGYDVLQTIRSNPATGHIPVIILSADATASEIKRLLEGGAKSYLTKPFDIGVLVAELNEVRAAK